MNTFKRPKVVIDRWELCVYFKENNNELEALYGYFGNSPLLLPEMVELAIQNQGFGSQVGGISFYEEQDEGDKVVEPFLPVGHVLAQLLNSTLVFPKAIFMTMLYEYSKATLKLYQKYEKKLLKKEDWFRENPDQWFKKMEEAIAKLKKHIEVNKVKWEEELKENN